MQSFVVVDGGTILATAACPLAFSRQARSLAPNISLGISVEPGEIRMLAGQEHCMSLSKRRIELGKNIRESKRMKDRSCFHLNLKLENI